MTGPPPGARPRPWWAEAVVYQIYPRSFCDTDGDGVGDLEGVRRHLDHLRWLGVDAIWLSPVYPSPMADFGYDVADYCDIDPVFGTLDSFDRLLADAHAAGLRLLLDWVPNHTSDWHPWFVSSRSARDSPYRDWYVWRDGRPDGAGGSGPPGSPGRLPNNWLAAFGGPAWTWDEGTGQWYLHLFTPGQPDLNWEHPPVVAAMHDTLRFWLDRGVDGFRIDVVHALGKDPELPDAPAGQELTGASSLDTPRTHELLRDLRRLLDSYPGDRVSVGEVYILDTARVATYYGTAEAPELHLAFNFPPLYAPWDAGRWRRCIEDTAGTVEAVGGWPTWVLSNHDNPRHRTRYGSEARARAAAVLLACLRGTPFLYAGEELGLEDAVIPAERRVDPGGRDGCRAPLPWDGGPGHGWGRGRADDAQPWLPWPPDADRRHATAVRADRHSVLHLYRRLLAARRASPALRSGTLGLLSTPPGLLAFLREEGDDRRLVAVNFTGDPLDLAGAGGSWTVEVDSAGTPPGPWSGRVAPDSAVVLVPTRP